MKPIGKNAGPDATSATKRTNVAQPTKTTSLPMKRPMEKKKPETSVTGKKTRPSRGFVVAVEDVVPTKDVQKNRGE